MAKKKSVHYVNNAEFSNAVVEYVKTVKIAKEAGEELPIVTNYIADCFLKICEGLSHKGNFIGYTFREELVMDGVENCLKAIENYNIEAATRTGKPNAFGYFTQIVWFAFLRRIEKEKKQSDIKKKFISQAGIDSLAQVNPDDIEHQTVVMNFVDTLKSRIDKVKGFDDDLKKYKKVTKPKKPRKKRVRKPVVKRDSDLGEFLE